MLHMFAAVLAGYLIATMFAFCGLVSTFSYLSGLTPQNDAAAIVNGLALAAWPLAVAALLFIASCLATRLQTLTILLTCRQTSPEPAPINKKHPAKPQQLHPEGTYFRAPQVQQKNQTSHQKADNENPVTEPHPDIPAASPSSSPSGQTNDSSLSYFRIS